MKTKRRNFLKLAGLGMAGTLTGKLVKAGISNNDLFSHTMMSPTSATDVAETAPNMIGAYGDWAASLAGSHLPSFSFRRNDWNDIEKWRAAARKRLTERLAPPVINGAPEFTIKKQYEFDGLHIEELEWQLPYGPATRGILLRPSSFKGPIPGILAFHDHGGNKYFGTRKITRTSTAIHPMMEEHQQTYYQGRAWANEIAKRGYMVLVPDAFPFASRRVLLKDVPEFMREGLTDENPEDPANIRSYNDWAGQHENIMAKSLFCAGTTWPGVFFAEDQHALNILCSMAEVDSTRIGCCGLSGGGMRTVFMGGLDARIKCAVSVGFMTTWNDFLLNKSHTHTWMVYVPLLPNELDFPEILGLRAPLPTMVLNDNNDDLYTLPEMKKADAILSDVFKKAGAPEHYKCSYYPGPHKFDAAMQEEAFNWFDRWLKK